MRHDDAITAPWSLQGMRCTNRPLANPGNGDPLPSMAIVLGWGGRVASNLVSRNLMMAYWILSGAEWGDWHAVRIDVRCKLRSRLAHISRFIRPSVFKCPFWIRRHQLTLTKSHPIPGRRYLIHSSRPGRRVIVTLCHPVLCLIAYFFPHQPTRMTSTRMRSCDCGWTRRCGSI